MTHSALSKLIPTRQSNPCPICGGMSGKCRTYNDSPLVLCMSFTQCSDTAPGYRYIKPTKDGQWAIWAPDDDAKFDRHAWKQRTELTRQVKQVQSANVMPLEERDRFYRDRLAKGSLQERDHADLRRRGLTDAEINELPVLSSDLGYAIVFQGLDGQFVGAQWRYAEVSDGGRYCWHNLPGGKYYPGTNELPLAVYRTENPIALALVEGTGIKPMLAAKRFEMIAIGAAGGNHVSSLTQLKAILTTFPNLPVHVAVDAGDVVNPQVMRRHRRTAETLQGVGIEAKFLWWNQLAKEDCDVDEIDATSFDTARLLTIAELEALIPNHAIQSERQYQQHEPSKRDRLIQNRRIQFNQYWDGGLKRDFQLSPIVAGVTAQVEYEGFCPTLDLDLADTIAVQGWLGAGKTESKQRSLAPIKDEWAILWSAPSNGLNRQTATRAQAKGFDTYHYQDDAFQHRWMLECNYPGLYLACPESFKPYAVGNVDWSTKILVIDEFSGIRKAIVHKSEQEQFFDAIAKCKQLLVADAFLSDADIALIRQLRGGSIALYRQKVQKSPVKINWIETRTKQGEISFNHDGVYFDVLQSWVDSGVRRMAIAVDSITYAKAIQKFLQGFTFPDGHQPRVWLACSETVEENSIFMPSPDQTIERNQIDIVIYTPTAKSGLDIQSPFERGLLICCGVLPPTEMLQMLGRCRHCPEWWVSAPRRPSNPGTTTPSLNGKRVQQWAEQISQAFEELGFNAPNHLQEWGVWQALTKDIEKAFGSEYIYALLLEYFESVTTIEVANGNTTAWRKVITQIADQGAENRLCANLENGLRLKAQQKQPSQNFEVWDLKLAEYHEKYPKLANQNVSDFRNAVAAGDDERRNGALELCKTLNSRRAEKLKNWVQAIESNPQDDLALSRFMRLQKINYNSPAFKARQNTELFRSLNLGQLAKLHSKSLKKLVANDSAFWMSSPVIIELHQEFQRDRTLKLLFPLVESLGDFWNAIKKCLRSFGYKSLGKSIRVDSEEMKPNGKNRDGSQRFSRSESLYFVGWLLMECSGNAYFRANFDLIIEAIHDRVVAEREERQKWRDRTGTPPEYAAA